MQGSKTNHGFDQDTGLEWIMRQRIRGIMEFPTKDQIYDNVSFKLGAFYKRYWENIKDGQKQNTRKSGQLVALAENMKQISRQDDRMIKVCAYARQISKFRAQNYQDWKQYIWIDLDPAQRKVMMEYVEQLSPPVPLQGETKEQYDPRERKHLFSTYKRMNRGMLLVEILEKIWTIRMYRKQDKPKDVERHIGLTTNILNQMKIDHPTLRGHLATSMGHEEWQEIEKLW